ncbi:MAG: metal ABC transporter permease [Thermomicrobiales bacterium]
MIDLLLTPWQHGFMQHAFIAIVMVGVICGITGVFVTLRGMAFLGDALSHAIFPGVVIAFITGGNFLIGALIAALIVSLGIGAVTQNGRINNDTAIGVFFVGAFALGIALLSLQKSYVRDLNAFLLGSILGVSVRDLQLIALVGAVVLGIIFWFRRELTMVSFDRTFAKASGLNLWFYDQLFLIVLAFTIVISLQTVGNILVLAMLVTPAATARLLSDRMIPMLGLSAFIGAASGIIGLYLSYYQGIPSGSGVVLVATAVFFVAYLFAPRTGIITSRIAYRMHRDHPERDADFLASAD